METMLHNIKHNIKQFCTHLPSLAVTLPEMTVGEFNIIRSSHEHSVKYGCPRACLKSAEDWALERKKKKSFSYVATWDIREFCSL